MTEAEYATVEIGFDASRLGRVEPVADIPGWDLAQRNYAADESLRSNPWANGRYAVASLAWGLIALIVVGIGGGP